MWLDLQKYKYHTLIEELLPISMKEKDEYVASGNQTHVTARYNEALKHGISDDRVTKWHIVPIMRNGTVTEYANVLPNMLEKIKTIPGVVNCTLNIYSPGGDAPIHNDYDYDMRSDLVEGKKCFAILLCLYVPSTDVDECGFELGGLTLSHKTGDIIAFDGSIPHRSWNNTTDYRYTVNIDVEQDYWDKA